MAALEPFLPAVQSGSAGSTQSIAVGGGAATSQTIRIPTSIGNGNNSLLVNAVGATAGTVAYLRLSVESSTVITATTADTPIIFNGNIPVIRLYASPNMAGAYSIAVVVSATPSTAGTIYFTPGSGGIV